MAIDPGRLRHQVTLQRATFVKDPKGGRELVPGPWNDVGTYWALVKPLVGRELSYARQVIATVSHSVTMRNIGPVTSADQLVFEGRVLRILAVYRVNELDEYYSILATEQPPPVVNP